MFSEGSANSSLQLLLLSIENLNWKTVSINEIIQVYIDLTDQQKRIKIHTMIQDKRLYR